MTDRVSVNSPNDSNPTVDGDDGTWGLTLNTNETHNRTDIQRLAAAINALGTAADEDIADLDSRYAPLSKGAAVTDNGDGTATLVVG